MPEWLGNVGFTRMDLDDKGAGDMGIYYPVYLETVEYLESFFGQLMRDGSTVFFVPKRAQMVGLHLEELHEEIYIDVRTVGAGGMSALVGALIYLAWGYGWRATYIQDGLWRDRAVLWFRAAKGE